MHVTPEDCRALVELRDGRQLHIRAVRPDDKVALLGEFHRLRPSSVRSRFFSSKKELSPDELRYFTEVDFSTHVALVAELRDGSGLRPVGIGRMIRTGEAGRAELALTVAEGLHGLGIGTMLMQQLVRLAAALEVRHLDASVLVENQDMLDVFRRSGLPMHTYSEEGTVTVTLDVVGAEAPL